MIKDATNVKPKDIIEAADREGHVPILTIWDERSKTTQFIEDLLYADTLPGRTYLVVTPCEATSEDFLRRLENHPSHDPTNPRVLVFTLEELELEYVRETVRLHLSTHPCASFIGRPRRDWIGRPQPALNIEPMMEPNINNIDRRIMQRGMFRVQRSRLPRLNVAPRPPFNPVQGTSSLNIRSLLQFLLELDKALKNK